MGVKRIIKRLVPDSVCKYLKPTIYSTATKSYIISTESSSEFCNKVAVVTGGSGAIGRAICFRLAAAGATVYVSGRTEASVMKIVNEMREFGLKAEKFVLDVSNAHSIESTFNSVFSNGMRLDILVNCAGGGARGDADELAEQKLEVIDSVLNSNLRGTMLVTRQAAKYMTKQYSGKIVIISSAVGVQGKAKYSEYAAAKAGLFGFTKSMALELGRYGINVNCVTPGFIQRGEYSDRTEEWLKTTNCLHAIGTLEDVANAVYFMVSDDSKFITGQNLIVDGGRTLGLYGDR